MIAYEIQLRCVIRDKIQSKTKIQSETKSENFFSEKFFCQEKIFIGKKIVGKNDSQILSWISSALFRVVSDKSMLIITKRYIHTAIK